MTTYRSPFMDSTFEATNAMLRFLLFGEDYIKEGGFQLAQEAKDRVTATVKNLGVSEKVKAVTGITSNRQNKQMNTFIELKTNRNTRDLGSSTDGGSARGRPLVQLPVCFIGGEGLG